MPRQRPTLQDPGVAAILTEAQQEKFAELMKVMEQYVGEWVGTREQGEQHGETIRRYYRTPGGPSIMLDVEAKFQDGTSFVAAKRHSVSTLRNTLLGFWFEANGNVQIFELDPKLSTGEKLVWNEVFRKGRLFRVEETIPKDDEFTVTALQQDDHGHYQVFAKTICRRRR